MRKVCRVNGRALIHQEVVVKKALGLLVSVALVLSLLSVVACSKGGGGDKLLGTWGMVGSPEKKIKILKEGDKYIYEGSQGKTNATKKDDNTLTVPMGPVEVTVKLDPATDELSVAFMGENYKYKRVQ